MSLKAWLTVLLVSFLGLSTDSRGALNRLQEVTRFLVCSNVKKAELAFQCRYALLSKELPEWRRRRFASDPFLWLPEKNFHECGPDAAIEVCGFMRIGARRAKIRFQFKADKLVGFRYR